MKVPIRQFAAIGAAVFFAASSPAQTQPAAQSQPPAQTQPPGQAQPPPQNPPSGSYQIQPQDISLSAGIGPAFVEDITIKNAGGAKNKVDVGYRASFDVAFKLSQNLSLGFETGGAGSWLDVDPGQPLFGFSDAHLYQVPILADLRLRFPLRSGITPYIGGGAGGVVSTLYLRTPFGVNNWDSDFVFAWQAEGGVRFSLDRNMEIGIGYKFLATGNHSWFSDNPFLATHTGDIYTHAIQATFTWNF